MYRKEKIAWIDDKEERGMLGREAKKKMAQCDTTTGRSDEKNKRNKGGKKGLQVFLSKSPHDSFVIILTTWILEHVL